MASEFDKKEMIVRMFKEIRLMKHTAKALAEMCQDSEDRVRNALGITDDTLESGRVPAKPEIVMPTKPCGCLEGHKCAGNKEDLPCLSEQWKANFIRRIKQNEISAFEAVSELTKVTDDLVDSVNGKCAADDTIRISRKVAEEWIRYKAVHPGLEDATNNMINAVKQALGREE